MAAASLDRDTDVVSVGRAWWLFLVTGVLWVVIAFMILAFDTNSVATIGVLVGCVIIFAGVNEFMAIALVDSWRWVHGVLGVVFVAVGVMALARPFQTFGILALLIGWYLLFKGAFDIVFSIAEHRRLDLWGLMLAAGIAELAIGAWALGSPARSAWLLVLWVGLGALIRGITEIVMGFHLHHAGIDEIAVA
jgi:uncharacterized membrane protein HdeD (DUF308 family)